MTTSSRFLTLSALAGVLTFGAVMLADTAATKHRSAPDVRIDKAPLTRDRGQLQSLAPVVKKVSPVVVSVYSSKTVRVPRPDLAPFFEDPMFRRFFGDQAPSNRRRGQGRSPEMRQQALGSGVIISSDGYILTNNHVVDGADEVKVALNGGQKDYTAEIVGRDPKTDVAVLKIDAKDLPAATLGDSDQLEVGDVAIAIGNPFGIGQTVTSGIVSALGRNNLGIEDYEDFIQTDAAINPGNSGGALIDAAGRVIGINTAIYSQSGGFMGVGFAIPMNLARSVMEQLITKGKIVRGMIGVNIQELTPDLKKEFKTDAGVLVNGVTPDSAADKAGIKQGDVITKLDGVAVDDPHRLRLMVGRLAPGTEVTVDLVRDGKTQTLKFKLGEQADQALGTEKKADQDNDEGTLNGVGVTDITPALRDELNLPRELQGAVISEVDPDSASAKAGLHENDVILEINRKKVESAKDAVELTSKPGDKHTLVLIWREGGRRYISIDESEPAKKK